LGVVGARRAVPLHSRNVTLLCEAPSVDCACSLRKKTGIQFPSVSQEA